MLRCATGTGFATTIRHSQGRQYMAARKQSTRRKQSSSSKRSASRRSSSSSRANARQPSDALALLRADHQTVQQLFQQFEKTRSEDRKAALAEKICNELTIHAQI